MTERELGILLGVLVSEGSFGGDGRQPSITIRMHVRHEALFHLLQRIVPGARLYGPYSHSGRNYYQLLIRGQTLRRILPVLDQHIVPELDGHAWQRYTQMKRAYRLLSDPAATGDVAEEPSDQDRPPRPSTSS